MKSLLSLAFAGVAVAQNGYGNPPPAYGNSTSCSSSSTQTPPHYGGSTTSTSAGSYPTPSCPAPGSTDSQGRYSCNPAHQYPAGQTCEYVDGCPYLKYPRTSSYASTSTATYACNPAHDYGNGASCISTSGTLLLVSPSSTKPAGYPVTTSTSTSAASYPTPSCPAPGSEDKKGRYSCSPAHQYPYGQTCELVDGCYFLIYHTTTTAPGGYPTSSKTGECTKEEVCYAKYNICRGAPDAGSTLCASDFATCLGYLPFNDEGTNTVTPAPCSTVSATKTESKASYPTDHYTTEVVTDYTTYCPQPTTFTHKEKTYTVTSATTLTLPCKGGCTVTKPVYSVPTTAPSVTKPVYPTLSHSKVWYNTTITQSPSKPVYTTKIVTSLTTYCPQPTTLTYGPSTYTVTKATTLVIPCEKGCTVVETKPPVYTTKIQTTAITTFCSSTTITHQGSTITVTKPTHITLPCDKGCTVYETKPPVYTTHIESSLVVPPKPTTYVETHPAPGPSTYAPPAPSTYTPPVPSIYTPPAPSSSSVVVPPPYPTQSNSSVFSATRPSASIPATPSSIVQYTGAAAPVKTGAPFVAAIAMGAFFL